MKQAKLIMLLFFIAFAWNKAHAGNPTAIKQFINHADWSFVENKGQLTNSDAKYYGHQGGVYLFCKPGVISFVFTKIERGHDSISEATGQPVETQCLRLSHASAMPHPPLPQDAFNASLQKQTTTNRADLILLNSNPTAEILASDQQEYYENYYTSGDANNGITNVHTYKTITYKSIYPNIDMVLYAKENGMKYEFVVYPGGKVNDIQMKWRGIESIKKFPSARAGKNSGIEYSLALGKMEESAPYSFVRAGLAPDPFGNMDNENKIESHFVLKNNQIEFKTGKYDKTKTLVIDPTLLWGTYFGGSGDESGNGIATDTSGNVYFTGSTSSPSNIATIGSYQSTLSGPEDAFVAKFSGNGVILWATYYGGNYGAEGYNIAIDDSQNVYATGISNSTSGIATTGAFLTSYTGYTDVFLAKFSNDGLIKWATYYGGLETKTDRYALGGCQVNGIATDGLGNAYITGLTDNDSGIATNGAFQTSYGGNTDAFLAKFNGKGLMQWSTYFGGNGEDEGYAMATDNLGNLYISGSTQSSSGIATIGAHQTLFGGNVDVFLAKFNSSGSESWSTYYGGSGIDRGWAVATDGSGNVYIAGGTESNYGIASNGGFKTFLSGSDDAFLAKFNGTGTVQWATYYGGDSYDDAAGITIDPFGNVCISGGTSSTNGIATNGAYQTYYGGSNFVTVIGDGYLASFNSNGMREWGTYYGGEEYDFISAIASDNLGNIYVTGSTSSNSNIATRWAYQRVYQNYIGVGIYDAFLAKFGKPLSNDAGIDTFLSPVANSCPDSLLVSVRLNNYGTAELDSVKIFLSVNRKIVGSYPWKGKLLTDSVAIINFGNIWLPAGIDTIKSWTYNPNGVKDSFPLNDTATTFITIYPLPPANAGPDTTLCYNESYTMQGSGGVTYSWHPATYLSSATDPKAIAVLPNTERYELVVTNSHGCQDSSPVLLKVRPRLKVKITGDSATCYGENIILHAKGSGGDSLHYAFTWPYDPNYSGDSLSEKALTSGWNKVVLSDNCSPVSASDSVYITVSPPVKAAFYWLPDTAIVKNPVNFLNQSTNASGYLWEFGTKDSSNEANPVYSYNNIGEYKVELIAFGLNGCPNDTAYGLIKVINELITIYIPNAFSPNGDGINDVFDISGVGIKSYSYNIYNRWGEHIFASPRPSPSGEGEGWDGTFKGAQVPEGVYIYMIDVVDVENQHHYLNGNLTLMR